MKRTYFIIVLFCFIFSLLSINAVMASKLKNVRVGNYQCWVIDSADESKSIGGTNGAYYYHGFIDYMSYRKGWALGAKDWVDENGVTHDVKVTVNGTEVSDEIIDNIPIPDKDGKTIHRYRRYQPPTVSVDGFRSSSPFPLNDADEVNPGKIPGTADIMVESWANTSIGVTIHQQVFAWSQVNHDDYVVYKYTFVNNGNIDLDPEIELPNNTLNDFYFLRTARSNKHHGSPRGTNWHSSTGEFMSDSLRMVYYYSSRAPAATYDSYGNIESLTTGFPVNPEYAGEVILHADTSPTDGSDNPAQPQMTDTGNSEEQAFKNASSRLNPAQVQTVYQIMQLGFVGFYPEWNYIDGPDVYPNTHHAVRFEDIGFQFPDEPWGRGHNNSFYSFGPYNLAHGDSITFIWAAIAGSISPEKGWEIGKDWVNGTVTPPEGFSWNNGAPVDNLPPPFKAFPEYYENSENNWAKDCWVSTGKDSLFKNAWAAQWNARNNFNVPVAPPAPSVTITSLPDRIKIDWDGTEQGTEQASDFAGYRVYRAVGGVYYSEDGGVTVGKWSKVFECGAGTENPQVVHSFEDKTAERGKAYHYYVTAFDDGSDNGPDVYNPEGGASLESGRLLNQSIQGAHLTRSAGTSLSKVRVVPNPFNISAAELQYPGEPDKIIFMDLPLECTIKIYTQSGDLVKTIEHYGSGDESWGFLKNEHSVTETGQIIVSGLYIAYIETPSGESQFVKFVVVR